MEPTSAVLKVSGGLNWSLEVQQKVLVYFFPSFLGFLMKSATVQRSTFSHSFVVMWLHSQPAGFFSDFPCQELNL